MSLSTETLNALQELMAKDTELLTQVQTTPNTPQAAAIIAQAAAIKGITVNEAELTTHLEQVSSAVPHQALSDQQLDAVGGGFMPSNTRPGAMADDEIRIDISVRTLGVGCNFFSIG